VSVGRSSVSDTISHETTLVSHHRIDAGNSGHRWNCFVVATFGDPRVAAFRREQQVPNRTSSRYQVPLANNSVMAILPDVTHQGWVYSIESCPDDLDEEEESCEDDEGRQEQSQQQRPAPDNRSGADSSKRLETLTLLISGNCTTMLRRLDNPVVRANVPQGFWNDDRRAPGLPPAFRRSSWANADASQHRLSIVSDASSKDSYDDESNGVNTVGHPTNVAAGHHGDLQQPRRRPSASPHGATYDAYDYDLWWWGQYADTYCYDRHGDPFRGNQDTHGRPFRGAWDEQQQQQHRRVSGAWDGGGCRPAAATKDGSSGAAAAGGSRTRPAAPAEEAPGAPSKRMRGILPEEPHHA
jgi:hypothetical protein